MTVEIGQLLADRRELLAQQELALLLLHPLAHVVADGLGDVLLRDMVAGPAGQPLEPRLRVDRVQQLGLLLHVQVWSVTGAVRERRRVGELLQRVNHLPGAPLLQDRRGERAVLAGKLVRARTRGGLFRYRRLHPQRSARAGGTRADADAGNAAHDRAWLAVWEPPDLLDRAERAKRRIFAIQPRHQQHARLGGGTDAWNIGAAFRDRPGRLDGGPYFTLGHVKRHHHRRQHHGVVQGEHRKRQRLSHEGLISVFRVQLPMSRAELPALFPPYVRG